MASAGSFPKTSTVDIIYQLDYNTIQSTIAGVLSTYYGQTPASAQISANPLVNDNEWDNLRIDINKCYKHITGADSSIANVAEGNLIYAADVNAYKTAADYCDTNKTTVNAAQLTSTVDSNSMTVAWNGIRTYKMTYTWTSAAAATAWFNLGGYFVVDVSGSNAVSAKDIDWRDNILNAIPTQTYTRSNWVTPTNIDVYEYGNNSKYSENYARIVCTKVSDTQLDISVIISDADVGDQTGTGPAVDENVDTDVYASVTRYSSYDAIVAPSISAVPVTGFETTTPVTVDLLIVGGGGAGGSGWPDNIGGGGAGGGGGGFTIVNTTLQAGLSYPVVVGAGGVNIPYPTAGYGGSGGDSSIAGYIAYGGEGGRTQGGGYSAIGGQGGTGSPNGITYYPGGAGGAYHSAGLAGGSSGCYGGGGGGGGVDDANNTAGVGGDGLGWTINGQTYGGGGGGGGDYSLGAAGGVGGGGHGGSGNDVVTAGTANTGGGGGGGSSTGGGSWGAGANGGSGVVIVSYVSGTQLFSGGAVTTSGGRYFHTFTTSGTLT